MGQDVDYQQEAGEEADTPAISPAEILVFLVQSAKRHRKLGIVLGLIVATIGVAVALTVPTRYLVRARILASQSAAIAAALSNPSRPANAKTDPFAGASDLLRERSSLLWIAQQSQLLANWKKSRTLPFRIKDDVLAALRGAPSEAAQMQGLVEYLAEQINVENNESTLTLDVYWRDPDVALKVAQLARSKLLEILRTQVLAAIKLAITINEEQVKRAAEGIETTLAELKRIRQNAREAADKRDTTATAASDAPKPRAGGVVAAAPVASVAPAPPDKRLMARLADIRQQIHDVEGPWQRRLAELKFQLSDLQITYGPEHPNIIQQQSRIAQASKVPPELLTLRESERQLLYELAQGADEGAKSQSVPKVATRARATPIPAQVQTRLIASEGTLLIAEREDDPVVAPAKENLSSAIHRYSQTTQQLENSRLELTSAQVALDYLYVVVGEPEKPRKPVKLNRPMMVSAALIAGVLFALLAGAVRDILSGKLLAPWQVKMLGLEVLGEVGTRHTSRLAPSSQPPSSRT